MVPSHMGKTFFTFFLMLASTVVLAQGPSQEFWDDPNIIWKTNTGTIITAEFAKKMHVEGNYTFQERAMRGTRKEIKMIPPQKASYTHLNWRDPNLKVVDEYGLAIPIEVARSLMQVTSNTWKVDTLQTGVILLTMNLKTKGRPAWTSPGMAHISEWMNKWRGKQLPGFIQNDVNGMVVSRSGSTGKVLVLSFWNSTCPECVGEIPKLNKVASLFSNGEVVFLAPTSEPEGTIRLFLEQNEFNYQVLPAAETLINELDIHYYPTHMIVDRQGYILDINVGGGAYIGEAIGKKLSWLLYD